MRNLRRRFMHWLWLLGDRRPERVTDKRAFEWAGSAATRVACALAGHEPTCDHCHIPEHDHCLWCQKPMPGQAHREVTGG